MRLRTAEHVNVSNKRVILRATLDVHFVDAGGELKVDDDARLQAVIPAIRDLVSRGAKVVLLSWLQRPRGKVVKEMSMAPVGKRLAELLAMPVNFLDDCVGKKIQKAISQAPSGSVTLLENVRFHPGEKDEEYYDDSFAKELAKNGDLFINDAFGQSHRAVASIVGIPKYLPSYAGPGLAREVKELSAAMTDPQRPFVGVIGGAKISSKMGVIKSLLKKVDYLLLGGALANTILRAKGIQVGTSLIEEKMVAMTSEFVLTDNRLHIPIDVVVAHEASEAAAVHTRAVGKVKEDEKILDIGPDTITLFEEILESAKTTIWNGPMGYFELKKFSRGTDAIAECMGRIDGRTIVGGGETVASIRRLGLESKMSFVSMGGGAMLDFIEYGTLPGIEPLRIT